MTTEGTLAFQHEPRDTNPSVVWVKMTSGEESYYIRMSCERALALGEALVETYVCLGVKLSRDRARKVAQEILKWTDDEKPGPVEI